MGTNDINIRIFPSPAEAPDYNTNGEGFRHAEITTAIVVRNGTEGGKATVDLQFIDPRTGQKYVAMITAALLAQVVNIAGAGGP